MLDEAPELIGDGFMETAAERPERKAAESLADDPLLRPPLYNEIFRGNIRRAEAAVAEGRTVFAPMPENEQETILPARMDPVDFLAEARKLRDWEASIVSGEDTKAMLRPSLILQYEYAEVMRREDAAAWPTQEFTPVEENQAVAEDPNPRPNFRLRAA